MKQLRKSTLIIESNIFEDFSEKLQDSNFNLFYLLKIDIKNLTKLTRTYPVSHSLLYLFLSSLNKMITKKGLIYQSTEIFKLSLG